MTGRLASLKRVLDLLHQLQRGRGVHVDEHAVNHNVHRRTALRDFRLLEDAGYAVYSDERGTYRLLSRKTDVTRLQEKDSERQGGRANKHQGHDGSTPACRTRHWCYSCHEPVGCSCGWQTRENHEHAVEDTSAD